MKQGCVGLQGVSMSSSRVTWRWHGSRCDESKLSIRHAPFNWRSVGSLARMWEVTSHQFRTCALLGPTVQLWKLEPAPLRQLQTIVTTTTIIIIIKIIIIIIIIVIIVIVLIIITTHQSRPWVMCPWVSKGRFCRSGTCSR